jgi:hypothetical protein
MSADTSADIELAEPKITIEDVKRRAEAVRDLAKSEAKRTTNEVLHEQVTRTIIVGVVAVAALASFAYFLGSRKGRASVALPPLPPYHSFPPQ